MTEPVLGLGDPTAALVEYLAAGSDIAEATSDADVGQRVFGFELPLEQAGRMPRTAIVIAPAGGFAERLPEVVDRVRVDVRAYAGSHDEAMRLAVLVRARLRALTRYTSTLGLVLHAVKRAGGYVPLREQAGGWPFVLRSYFVLFDETLVT